MKTKLFYSPLLILSFLLFLPQCSKDRIKEKQQMNEYEPINNYFNNKKQNVQEFVIDTSGQGPIVGIHGTKIWPEKTKLMYPNGDSVYFPFILKLIELYTPKDMIYYQMPSVSDGNLLTTDGEICIKAFKDGQELLLRPGNTWTIEMPNANPQTDMIIYYGQELNNYVNWVANTNQSFNTTSYGYMGQITNLGWIGCDKPAVSSGTYTNYTFSSTTDNLSNVAIFMYYPNLKSLMQVYNQTSDNAPIGDSVKIVMMGINSSNELYHYYQETIVSSSLNHLNVTLTPISDAEMTAILDSL